MRILACGDRNWTNRKVVESTLSEYADPIIIEGECRGADRISQLVATSRGWRIEPYPAQWNIYGRAAGPIRNQQMLDDGKLDLVIAFHNNIAESKGTANMVKLAKLAGIPVRVVSE